MRIVPICLMMSVATPALAQQAAEMVLLPRPIAEKALEWIAAPNANNAVMLYASFAACLNDNPHNGVTARSGQDQCPAVSDAVAAREKEIADLKKQISDMKPAPVASAEPGK